MKKPIEKSDFSKTEVLIALLLITTVILMFFTLKSDEKHGQVKKPVTAAKVAANKEIVANRVVRDNQSVSNNEGGPVTVRLDLGDLGFDLKNAK